ncbi:MAG: flavodoxin family protein [Lentisphaeria bacterium]|nr:flavodoxin family protein [Lentisphaeria bacterium]
MKVIAVNGSPRKNWNTDTLLKNVLEGAASAGAETEMVYLYDLKFCGCKSCMACKLKKEPRPNRCVLRDELSPVLDRLHAADIVVLGSPIYFSETTGEFRSFFERFLFQYLNYDDYSKPLSPAKRIGLVFTMNCPESMFDQIGYPALFQRYENWMKLYFGHCETLLATDTMQVKDYSRYHLGRFDADAKQIRHESVFPEDCRKAYALGVNLCS